MNWLQENTMAVKDMNRNIALDMNMALNMDMNMDMDTMAMGMAMNMDTMAMGMARNTMSTSTAMSMDLVINMDTERSISTSVTRRVSVDDAALSSIKTVLLSSPDWSVSGFEVIIFLTHSLFQTDQ